VSHVDTEITSQPACWRKAAEIGTAGPQGLPARGERVAVIGCGTSLFMAQAYAVLRERAGQGETDAFAASEFPASRSYDRVVALTRSGTTTEVLAALSTVDSKTATVAITADPATPIMRAAKDVVVLDFADEQSVVQTRFATSALILLRAHLGEEIAPLVEQATEAVNSTLPEGITERTQFTFLGSGWSIGIANEAALKLREASRSWAESYPGKEFRHGPISIADERSTVWIFGEPADGLLADLKPTGALIVTSDLDPLAELIRAQRLAVALATARGLDPDAPRNLTRSVILT
jgi:fructoselysine-6-P-deglycase FrlB-like protein